MDLNLLEMTKRMMSGDMLRQAAAVVGESEGTTRAAVDKLLPALVGGIAAKGATPDGARGLLSTLSGVTLPGPESVAAAGGPDAPGRVDELLSTGKGLVSSLFGERAAPLANALAGSAGIKGNSATNLIALATPLVLGVLKKVIGERGLDASGLASLLTSQGSYLQNIDGGLTRALGFASPQAMLGGLSAATGAAADFATRASAQTIPRQSGLRRAVPWLLGALALLALFSYLGRPREANPPVNAPSPMASAPATPSAPPAPESSPAAPAAAQDAAPAAAQNEEIIAKVYFNSGKTAIDKKTRGTITEAARTIKRDAKKVVITGYADSTGQPAVNAELAKHRAEAVKAALVAEGVPEDAVALRPPEATTGSGSDEEARRVEIGVMAQ